MKEGCKELEKKREPLQIEQSQNFNTSEQDRTRTLYLMGYMHCIYLWKYRAILHMQWINSVSVDMLVFSSSLAPAHFAPVRTTRFPTKQSKKCRSKKEAQTILTDT